MGVRHKRMEQLDGQNSSFIEGEDDYNKSENYIVSICVPTSNKI